MAKPATSGIVLDRPGSGTYQVKPDCTGTTHFEPVPGIVIEERFVPITTPSAVATIPRSVIAALAQALRVEAPYKMTHTPLS